MSKAAEVGSQEIDAKYICPICMDVLESPLRTPCLHSFCSDCLTQALESGHSACPNCRAAIDSIDSCLEASDLIAELSTVLGHCRNMGCSKEVPLSQLKNHEQHKCRHQAAPVIPKASAIKRPAHIEDTPNRSTFKCPFAGCPVDHLPSKALVDHITSTHSRAGRAARSLVCPICSSMPWGDSTYRSADIVNHMQTRHKFEYAEYTDYSRSSTELDEEALFQEVLRRSMTDH